MKKSALDLQQETRKKSLFGVSKGRSKEKAKMPKTFLTVSGCNFGRSMAACTVSRVGVLCTYTIMAFARVESIGVLHGIRWLGVARLFHSLLLLTLCIEFSNPVSKSYEHSRSLPLQVLQYCYLKPFASSCMPIAKELAGCVLYGYSTDLHALWASRIKIFWLIGYCINSQPQVGSVHVY